jgi:SMP-30/gluconolaconase/LRE-like protein
MGSRAATCFVFVLLSALVVAFETASSATRVRVSLLGTPQTLTAGQAWTARLAVRPASFDGALRLVAKGPGTVRVRATGRRGSYRARLRFPRAGRWTLTALAGRSTSRLGSVRVAAAPLTFVYPTTIDLEPSGTLLLVENGRRRLLRVDPATGRTTVLASSLSRPFGVARSSSGSIYFSDESVKRLDGSGPVEVAPSEEQVGPVAVAPNGDVYYATVTRVFRLAVGTGTPVRIAGTGAQGSGGDGGPATSAQVSAPHGLAFAADGALLISDTQNDRIRRIDPLTGVITSLAEVGIPDGLEVASDGTIYVAEARTNRVVHLSASGARLGLVGPRFNQPFDVAVSAEFIYVLETGTSGRVRRIAR